MISNSWKCPHTARNHCIPHPATFVTAASRTAHQSQSRSFNGHFVSHSSGGLFKCLLHHWMPQNTSVPSFSARGIFAAFKSNRSDQTFQILISLGICRLLLVPVTLLKKVQVKEQPTPASFSQISPRILNGLKNLNFGWIWQKSQIPPESKSSSRAIAPPAKLESCPPDYRLLAYIKIVLLVPVTVLWAKFLYLVEVLVFRFSDTLWPLKVPWQLDVLLNLFVLPPEGRGELCSCDFLLRLFSCRGWEGWMDDQHLGHCLPLWMRRYRHWSYQFCVADSGTRGVMGSCVWLLPLEYPIKPLPGGPRLYHVCPWRTVAGVLYILHPH